MCLLWWWSAELAISSWALILFSFLLLCKVVKLSRRVWRLDYICKVDTPVIPCGSFTQHNSVIFTVKLLSSRYIARGNLDPVSSSIILPSTLTDLLILKKNEFLFIYLVIICPSRQAQKNAPLRWETERRWDRTSQANVLPGMWVQCVLKCLFIRKHVQHGTQRKVNVDLGMAVATCPWPQKYLELI